MSIVFAQVSTAASGNVEREREVEALSTRLEHTQLATHTTHPKEGKAEQDDRRPPPSSTDSPGLSGTATASSNHSYSFPLSAALLWSKRRDRLDQQEAELLKRVQGVREKVVGHMTGHRDHMT